MQLSEVVLLLIAVAVVPLLVAVGRKTDVIASNGWFAVGYAAMLVTYTLTIVEGVGGDVGWWCNVGEHAALLVAGVAFALAIHRLRASVAGVHGGDT